METRPNEAPGCALYMRLSREDERGTESASIETQRSILRRYAREHGLRVHDEYVDDGYTGTNLDRPAFRRMLRDIEAGRVGIVLTKDVSRLGRNNGRVSMLLDEYFPQHRVRYISVGEGHDSAARTASSLLMPVHNFVNELYAADISGKIHAALESKMKEGAYIGAFAPYGYRKDPRDRNRLCVDDEAAAVVRRIFALARDGHSPAQIAAALNREGVPTPSQYRAKTQPQLPPGAYRLADAWRGAAVSRLLRCETYLGRTVQGKTYKPSFKLKTARSQPRDAWIVVPDTHEALVNQETWSVVRRRMQSRARVRDRGFVNVLSGLAKCADCGKSMSATGTRRRGARANLVCGGYKLGGRSRCTSHAIDYDTLCGAVRQALRRQFQFSEAERAQLCAALAREEDGGEAARRDRQLAALRGRLERLLDDRYAGRIPAETFSAQYQKIAREQARLTAAPPPERDASARRRALLDACCAAEPLTPAMLFHFIDRIDVHQGVWEAGVKRQRIDIRFRFACAPATMEVEF